MLLTNPLACPETVQQTGQKHFKGTDQQPATGCETEQQLSASGRDCMSVVIVGNKGHKGVQEVWEGDIWSDGYEKYRDRKSTGSIGKGPKQSTTHIRLPENRHPRSPPQTRHQSPIPSHPASPPPRDTKQFPTHSKPHPTKEKYHWR